MIEEETLDGVFARHARLAEATRAAVRAWGADGKGPTLYGQTEDRLSNSVTTVMMPEGHHLRSPCARSRSSASTCRWAAGSGR